jgi:hypothetical protein
MQIELRKETSTDGIWYMIYIDNQFHKCKRDLKEAYIEFEKTKDNIKHPPISELLELEII